jgi:hypothetical protein
MSAWMIKVAVYGLVRVLVDWLACCRCGSAS